MDEELRKVLEKVLSEQKREVKFIDNVLLEIAEFKYNKVYNLAIGLIGILSPMLPITFLFRKDLIYDNDIIPILIITIVINIIIFVSGALLNKINRYSNILLINMKIMKNISKFEIKSYRLENGIKKMENIQNTITKELDNIIEKRINKRFIKVKLMYSDILLKYWKYERKKQENLNKRIKKMVEEKKYDIEEKDNYEDFKAIIIANVVIGQLVIVFKVLSYLGVSFINFKYILMTVTGFYGVIFGKFIFYQISIYYNKIIKRIYDYINVKITKKTEPEYKQISMFED